MLFFTSVVRAESKLLNLTNEERAFLSTHPTFSVHVEANYAPYSFLENDQFKGYSVDFSNLIAERLGINFHYNRNENWDKAISNLRNGKSDIVAQMIITNEREALVNFTSGYMKYFNSIVTRKNSEYHIKTIENLSGRTVGVVGGYTVEKALADHFPQIKVLPFEDTKKLVDAVITGKIDAAIATHQVVQHDIQNRFISDIISAPILGNEYLPEITESFGIQKKYPLLHSAMQKAIDSLEDEKQKLQLKWFGEAEPKIITFTANEWKFLKAHGPIRYCVDPSWKPLEFLDKSTHHQGLSADFIKLFTKNSGVGFELVPTKTWTESLNALEERRCDVAPLVAPNQERLKYMAFTKPYLVLPLVIATKSDVSFISDFRDVLDKSFAVVKGYAHTEEIRNNYKGVRLIEVSSVTQGLESVRSGKTFGFIDTVASIGQAINENDITGLKITGKLVGEWRLGVGVRNDLPVLLAIMQKHVAAIDDAEKQRITNQWIAVRYEKGFDYRLFWQLLAVVTAIGLFLLFRYKELSRVNAKLTYAVELAGAALESTADGVVIVNRDGRISRYNQRFIDLWRVPKSLLDMTVTDPVLQHATEQMVGPDIFLSKVRDLYAHPEDSSFDMIDLKDGRIFERYSQPLRIGDEITGRFWSFRDVTERELADQALAKSERRYRAIFETSADPIAITRLEDGSFYDVNQAFLSLHGFSRDEVIGHTSLELNIWADPNARTRLVDELKKNRSIEDFEAHSRKKDGSLVWGLMSTSLIEIDGIEYHLSITKDVTERKHLEEKLHNLAFYDQLTGVANRSLLHDRLKQAISASGRSSHFCALLLIDLDNFKSLNDTYGHHVGDLLLIQVAQRLSECVCGEDTVARLGGDEFVVMLTNLSNDQQDAVGRVEVVYEKIIATLNPNFQLGNILYSISCSIGANLFLDQQISADTLLKQVELAMYKAKDSGRNTIRFFEPEMERIVIQRNKMEEELRHAIENKQFVLFYQPQIVAERISGCEALVRWPHPEQGMVSPAAFIQLAEETGHILSLGNLVLETACAQLAKWAGTDMAHLTIAVNVSAHQIHQPNFVEQVLTTIQNTGANPEKLKLELTESLLVSDVNDVIEKMYALKAKGVSFSLDDFGTGYSSLLYLKRLPLDQLKIDQSFVRDVLVDPNDATIARTIIALSQTLGIGVIAEGVETVEQRDFLANAGCLAYQGYLFSRPLPVNDFENFFNTKT